MLQIRSEILAPGKLEEVTWDDELLLDGIKELEGMQAGPVDVK